MKRYQIIYADPPWQYRNYGYADAIRGVEKEYRTMTTEDICALPISELAADDCILFCWGTWTHLPDVLQVIEAWGFEYQTIGFVWVKTNPTGFGFFMGMGNYTRSNTEYCLIATKGKPKRIRADILQIVHAPVREHSRKPSDMRERIVNLMGDLPRIELFARKRVDGWDAWGNEVESDLPLDMAYEKA
jgi:N6-adenosine-specific RNA methylase IME4